MRSIRRILDVGLALAPLAAPPAVAGLASFDFASNLRVAFFVSILASGWLVGWSVVQAGPVRTSMDVAVSVAVICVTVIAIAGQSPVDAAYFSFFGASALLLGRFAAGYKRRVDLKRLELRAAKAERASRVERAAAEVRASLAAELHDVIGHSVGAMTLQAGAARLKLETGDLEAARDALLEVEMTGHAALVDLRRMLGILRNDMAEAS